MYLYIFSLFLNVNISKVFQIVASAQNGKTVTEGEEKPVAVNVLPQSIKGGEDKESGIKNRRRKVRLNYCTTSWKNH